MKLAKQMRKLGWICFTLMMVLLGVFVAGMATMPENSFDLEDLPDFSRYSLFGVLALLVPTLVLIVGSSIPRILTHRALRANGLPAQARILKVSDTGMRINDSPVVRLLLEVRAPGQPVFQAETERWISMFDIPRMQPGAVVRVIYDPQSLEVVLAEEEV